MEDEVIRKEIIDYCYERLNTSYGALPKIEAIKRWLAWLEKQGEQKPVLDFKASNWYVSKVDGKIHDMTYNPTDRLKQIIMKELSTEEKAKRYDEALERAKSFDLPEYKNIMVFIFPELKESEDERIRKELIELISCMHDADPRKKDWLAWLEKQGTPQTRTGDERVNTIDDACNKRYSEEYAHGEYCHEQSFKWGFQEGVEWLEKQGK